MEFVLQATSLRMDNADNLVLQMDTISILSSAGRASSPFVNVFHIFVTAFHIDSLLTGKFFALS